MTIAIILVIAAVLALVFILGVTLSRSLQISGNASLAKQIRPIDVQAFRNLVDPAEDEYLRRRLSGREFRVVRRKRLRAMAAYVQIAGSNAAILVRMGQAALSAADAPTAEAARRLIDNALLLRRNAAFALLRIYIALAWPNSGLAAAPVLHGYEQLNGSAMLLGRLQNPAVPVRISATLMSFDGSRVFRSQPGRPSTVHISSSETIGKAWSGCRDVPDSSLVFACHSVIKPPGFIRSRSFCDYIGYLPRESFPPSARLRELKGEPYDPHSEICHLDLLFPATFRSRLWSRRRCRRRSARHC